MDKKAYMKVWREKNKESIIKCRKEYYEKTKDKNLENSRATSKEYYKNNREKVLAYHQTIKERTRELWKLRYARDKKIILAKEKEYGYKNPWVRTYRSIVSRCATNPFYIKKNIKYKITVTELKELWFRDKAYEMKKPSIDRIDREKGYYKDNCQYLEFSENLRRRVFNKQA